ncbi:hypothetical protein ILP97_00950 [Amycolatopsis sp. H6(2020)]|nr:hypothetical protein [Amycolatopsis sp. H6(2020)]
MSELDHLCALEMVDDLLERSSLGTSEARSLRDQAELANAEAIVALADQPEGVDAPVGSPLFELDDILSPTGDQAASVTYELLNRLATPLTRYCRAGLGSTSRADDIAQQLLIDILDYLRQHTGDTLEFLRWTVEHASEAVSRASTGDPTVVPLDRFAALARVLPAVDRDVLLLRVALELTCTEVGALLDIEPEDVLKTQTAVLTRFRSRTEHEQVVGSTARSMADTVGSRTVVCIDLAESGKHRTPRTDELDALLKLLDEVSSKAQVPPEAIEQVRHDDSVILVCRYPELAVWSLVDQLLVALVDRNTRAIDPNARIRAAVALGTGYVSRDEPGAEWVGGTIFDVRGLAATTGAMLAELPWAHAVLSLRPPVFPVFGRHPDQATPFQRTRIATKDGDVEAYVQHFGVTPSDPDARGWFEAAFDSVTVAGGRRSGKTTFTSSVADAGTRREVAFPAGLEATVGRVEMHPDLTLAVMESPAPGIAHLPGSLGTVLIVDTRTLADCFPLIDDLEARELPYVVAVNEMDGTAHHSLEEIHAALEITAPILRFDVGDKASALSVLKALLDRALPTAPRPRQPGSALPRHPQPVSDAPRPTDDWKTDQIPALAGFGFDHHEAFSTMATAVFPAVAQSFPVAEASTAEYGRHAAEPDMRPRSGRHRPPR